MKWMGALLLCCLTLCVARAESVPVPALHQRVTDLTQTLSESQQQQIENRLLLIQQKTRAQLAVLILPTTGDDSIEQFAVRVFEQWKLGHKARDDGALLLVALRDRSVRIEVGYGLEDRVTDVQAGRIIRNSITPLFRQRDYYGGIMQGVESLGETIQGKQLPPPVKSRSATVEPLTSGVLSPLSDNMLNIWFVSMMIFPAILFQRRGHFSAAQTSAIIVTVICVLSSLIFGGGIHNFYDVLSFVMVLIASFILQLIGLPILLLLKGGESGEGSSSDGGGDSYSGDGGSSGGGGASDHW
ncbi:YgcG family protein [Brenneria sp. 4F2]|nr:YgcG family protein [Brenneria bubanii]